MQYKTILIEGVRVFYREAGAPGAPKLLLLHGFPTASHAFQSLMTALAHRFHIIAPDYPGSGHSDLHDPAGFTYTFDALARTIGQLCRKLGFDRFGLYVQGAGAAVGLRVVTDHPEWLEWLIVQNANIYEIGTNRLWDELRETFWADRSIQTEAALIARLSPAAIETFHRHGHRKAERLNPDAWMIDNQLLARPGAREALLDLLYDDRNNTALYPVWQRFLADRQPPALILWGQGDLVLNPAGGEAYLTALPDAELHRLESGHFALEDSLEDISDAMTAFYDRVVRSGD